RKRASASRVSDSLSPMPSVRDQSASAAARSSVANARTTTSGAALTPRTRAATRGCRSRAPRAPATPASSRGHRAGHLLRVAFDSDAAARAAASRELRQAAARAAAELRDAPAFAHADRLEQLLRVVRQLLRLALEPLLLARAIAEQVRI